MKSKLVMGFVLGALSIIVVLAAFEKGPAPVVNKGSRIPVICTPTFNTDKLKWSKAPLLKGLGNLHYKITTASRLAQQYFNQGLTLVYAFNHGEAARSFQEVIKLDSTAAMGWWGIALVLGPNYNAALNPTSLEDINKALVNARKYSVKASKKEQILIDALSKRFPAAAVNDMTSFNEGYAAAMKKAHEQFPGDAEIAVLYADALMNEHPWNLWLKDGNAQPWTAGIEGVLEKVMAAFPNHPGALHLYLHAVEASRTAHRGIPAADRLLDMLPAAGHLVHMPAHIYIRTGHYQKGVAATEKARIADSTYIIQCQSEGTYPLLYYPHNTHFLAACAFLAGNAGKATEAAWGVSRQADRKYLAESGTVQHYYIIPYYVLVHLGKWDDILAIPAPGESLKYPRAIWHYARGMAMAGKGKLPEAQKELKTLQGYLADESLRTLLIWETNSSLELVSIAAQTLEAELLSYEGRYDEAVTLLKSAATREDKLNYQEPPDWFFSVRHSLGHVLVLAKRFTEAEQVYREDLVTYPENGWALMGLYNSLTGQHKTSEAAVVRQRFDKAWQWADIRITSSRKY
jgi:tetratricopeptide (TPR) repeat protein